MKNIISKTTALLLISGLNFVPILSAEEPPVQVYILSGQSNMVGIGQVDGRGSHWRGLVSEPMVSVYPGNYDPAAD